MNRLFILLLLISAVSAKSFFSACGNDDDDDDDDSLTSCLSSVLGNSTGSVLGTFLGDHGTVIFQNALVKNTTACPSMSVIFARGTLEPGELIRYCCNHTFHPRFCNRLGLGSAED